MNTFRSVEPKAVVESRELRKQYPLKWHKWLTGFNLAAGAVMNILQSFGFFTGNVYRTQGLTGWQVYRAFPTLQVVDFLYGFALIAMAVYAFKTRSRLAAFKKEGPDWLLRYYKADMGVSIGYALLSSASVGSFSGIVSSIAAELITTGLILWLTKKYYDKRKVLFVD